MMAEGWGSAKLGALAQVNPDQLGNRTDPDYLLEYLDIAAIQRPGVIGDTRTLTFAEAPSRARRRVCAGDILVSTVRPYLRNFARVREAPRNLVASTGYAVVRPSDGVDGLFLYQHVMSEAFVEFLKPRMSGSNYPAVRSDDVEAYTLSCPPLPEQGKIAAILSSVDDAIEKTQAVIDQVQVVKRGLMQELLTRGLRSASGSRTEWIEESFGNLFTLQLGKMLNKKAREALPRFPYLGNRDVQWGRLDFSELREMYFSEREREKFRLVPGDLLVCEGGEIGRTAIWTGEFDCYYQKAIHRLRVRDQGKVEPRFILHFMRFAAANGLFTDLTSQSSIAHLTREKLALLRVPLPPLLQQRKIAAILSSVDDYTTQAEAMIRQAQVMKQGLMSVLLTGELRVSHDAEVA